MNAHEVERASSAAAVSDRAAVSGPAAANTAAPLETRSVAPTERVVEASELRMAVHGEPVLLAIDTALGTSVALGIGGRAFEVVSDESRGHAEVIGDLMARVFEFSGASPAEVTGVVTGIGPGPFTGLRVGIAAAHAFATGRGVPVLPLQGHEAVALAVFEAGAAVPDVRVIQDARRRELFVTEYSGLDWRGVPLRSTEAHIVARADHEPDAFDVWPERIPAARLVQLAARRLASTAAAEAISSFEPDQALYLRAPDVKAPGAPKRVTP